MGTRQHMGTIRADGTITIDGFTAEELRQAHDVIDGARAALEHLEKLPAEVKTAEPFAKLIEATRSLARLQDHELPPLSVLSDVERERDKLPAQHGLCLVARVVT